MENEVVAGTADTDGYSWRDLAVARSLDSARIRAENRVQRFLDAAIELLNEGSGKDFTVQEVVERSGQSLRSFYQYFNGKHELLLALFEETVRSTVDALNLVVSEEDDPLERLHIFVVEYHQMCRPSDSGNGTLKAGPRKMVEFAQQLLTTHPKEAAKAFAPLVALFDELLRAAIVAGSVREDVRNGPLIGVVLEAIMFNSFSSTIAALSVRQDDGSAAEELWRFVLRGIGSGA
jgi:AcrR family transcriptional regulator